MHFTNANGNFVADWWSFEAFIEQTMWKLFSFEMTFDYSTFCNFKFRRLISFVIISVDGMRDNLCVVVTTLDSNPKREILSPFTKEFRAWGQLEFSFFFRTHCKWWVFQIWITCAKSTLRRDSNKDANIRFFLSTTTFILRCFNNTKLFNENKWMPISSTITKKRLKISKTTSILMKHVKASRFSKMQKVPKKHRK